MVIPLRITGNCKEIIITRYDDYLCINYLIEGGTYLTSISQAGTVYKIPLELKGLLFSAGYGDVSSDYQMGNIGKINLPAWTVNHFDYDSYRDKKAIKVGALDSLGNIVDGDICFGENPKNVDILSALSEFFHAPFGGGALLREAFRKARPYAIPDLAQKDWSEPLVFTRDDNLSVYTLEGTRKQPDRGIILSTLYWILSRNDMARSQFTATFEILRTRTRKLPLRSVIQYVNNWEDKYIHKNTDGLAAIGKVLGTKLREHLISTPNLFTPKPLWRLANPPNTLFLFSADDNVSIPIIKLGRDSSDDEGELDNIIGCCPANRIADGLYIVSGPNGPETYKYNASSKSISAVPKPKKKTIKKGR